MAPQDADDGGPRPVSGNSSASSFHRRIDGPGRYLRIDDNEAVGTIDAADLDGVALGGAAGTADAERLGARLAVVEAETDLADGAVRVVIVVDTPQGVLALPSCRPSQRLAGLACDPARLSVALGCAPDAPAIGHARALTVLAARTCGVPAILVVPAPDAAAEREGFAALLLDDDK